MSEDQCENRGQDEKQDEDAAIAIDVEKLLVSHAADCA
jgi:hypothetical protein